MSKPREVWYLAGPMTGIPQFNIPAFRAAARNIRDKYDVELIVPHEEDSQLLYAKALASLEGSTKDIEDVETVGEIYGRCVSTIIDREIDCIVLLPGWEKSKGTALELYVATYIAKAEVKYYFPSERDVLPTNTSESVVGY